ncbi:MAG: tRNA threonylcarbamoyladenosine dehydratase [Bacteroidaceae bacterium]|nr:tRNA threonylcarbamoyladenosine dehydratase [Bacteroidaceae bacterium]
MQDNWLQRGELLLGEETQQRLARAHILIVGVGGVGSWAAEMLCRAGVGCFTIVDADCVDVTNINRQMPALSTTVGEAKCSVVANRMRAINPNVKVTEIKSFIDEESAFELIASTPYDFVVDAIDTLPSKAALIRACWQYERKIVSSMGAGAKSDLKQIRVADLWKSEQCTLAKNLRRLLREYRSAYHLPVIFSVEHPVVGAIKPNPDGGKPIIGSIGYFTATFGCYLTEYVIHNI